MENQDADGFRYRDIEPPKGFPTEVVEILRIQGTRHEYGHAELREKGGKTAIRVHMNASRDIPWDLTEKEISSFLAPDLNQARQFWTYTFDEAHTQDPHSK